MCVLTVKLVVDIFISNNLGLCTKLLIDKANTEEQCLYLTLVLINY